LPRSFGDMPGYKCDLTPHRSKRHHPLIHEHRRYTTMLNSPPQLAVVVPCYNEEEVLPETCSRLTALLRRLETADKIRPLSKIYFVDDGSRDKSWDLIAGFARANLPVVGVKLSRNQGHQNALVAGLFSARGDAIVSVDADLQDDLEAIERMVDFYLSGCDVVLGVRKKRDTDAMFKRVTAESFYRLMATLGAQTVHNHADYRLMSRRAVDALREYREVNLYLRGIVPLIGFPTAIVEYERSTRFAGESKYPFKKMVGLALEAVTSFSAVPLRLISVLGFAVFAGAMFVSGWALWATLFTDKAIPGWASVVLPMYFLGGVQLLALGVIGEYLGKLYVESKARPRYFIEQHVEGTPASDAIASSGGNDIQQMTPSISIGK
jgi:polyisoprenyl-phosphate glycosyltransferase